MEGIGTVNTCSCSCGGRDKDSWVSEREVAEDDLNVPSSEVVENVSVIVPNVRSHFRCEREDMSIVPFCESV